MTINLSKGEKINLTKDNKSLNNVTVGLGWDMIEPKEEKKGLFGFLKSKPEAETMDLDASILLLDSNDKLISKDGLVFFGNLVSACKGVKHQGDNLTGAGSGDDEVIKVSLNNVDSKVNKILFVVNIYRAFEKNQHFGLVENAFIRIVDESTNTELVKYKLTEDYSGFTSVIIGELYKENSSWNFKALGDGLKISGLQEIRKLYV